MATIIHLYNNIYFSVLWEQKINILGGIFLGLAIFSYFYKKYIDLKRLKQILKIKNELDNIRTLSIIMTEFNSDHLERLEKIKGYEQINYAIEGVRLQLNSNNEVITIKLNALDKKTDDILEQAKKTNGRVTILEDKIDNKADEERVIVLEKAMMFLNWLKKNKWYIAVIALAFMKIYDVIPFKSFFDVIIKLLTAWI